MLQFVKYMDVAFFIFMGCIGLLIAYRKWPENQNKKEEWDAWHKSHGKTMKIISPIIIALALIKLLVFS